MTDSNQAAANRLLWYEHLDVPLSVSEADRLKEQLGINAHALGDPDEWVLGHRFVGVPALESATILYLTRRRHNPGVRFELSTMAATPPDTTRLHELVKQYIQQFSSVSEPSRKQTERGAHEKSGTPHSPRLVVVDYRPRQLALSSEDVALARAAHISPRLAFEVPGAAVLGLSGTTHMELRFHADDTLDVTVALAHDSLADRGRLQGLRVHAAIGDQSVAEGFNSQGMATIRNLDADSRTDLLHLTFEVEP
ncbi:hypothetical protein OG304_06455 [Streptomyces sp. NBC_00160]|uniref:hypothetical protein n=1 Tax=Streptomyces sp. NBC_00160 TaxID=2903628 RepID=UPI0022550F1F|nr:hypothetical protein [Streptomyces sp. NBC_00160]MCX5303094.1 hypothetical protein [Streptomyces sp. NBC_00160]